MNDKQKNGNIRIDAPALRTAVDLFSYEPSADLALEAMYSSYIASGCGPALTFREYSTSVKSNLKPSP